MASTIAAMLPTNKRPETFSLPFVTRAFLFVRQLMAVGRSGALLKQLAAQLNPSQVVALKHVLRNRVALVQGPPGTGKTYLGCKVRGAVKGEFPGCRFCLFLFGVFIN